MAPRVAFKVDRHVSRKVWKQIIAARCSADGVTFNESEIAGSEVKKNVEELSRKGAEK